MSFKLLSSLVPEHSITPKGACPINSHSPAPGSHGSLVCPRLSVLLHRLGVLQPCSRAPGFSLRAQFSGSAAHTSVDTPFLTAEQCHLDGLRAAVR